MSNWLKGPNGERVYLAGTLVKRDFDTQEKEFLLKLALTPKDDGMIKNIKIGEDVAPNKEKNIPATKAKALTCFHQTIPRANFTAFYRRLNSTEIILIGEGEHTTDNQHYEVDWADGTKTSIFLKKKATTGADEYLATPKQLSETGAFRPKGSAGTKKKKMKG
ncbi:Uncharacterized protein OS=Thalassospira permensis NBRC 106175 GN=SMB34_12540 PE=4 SV=1 [Gemmata massiliana]|uniref:Uncharacterized protein n=1 Tax=Gemmata massiliana TaxID=1210884 RepID=A0A6P2D6U8_9BACT|nr:hypothetical protein [Gemmata massiliana]VTR96869.1 Uncharacterized protein OS=Thalassospira permensis NBRC 106175 GN=SMB34_12540 PE=4 SV=1 [Gemmata massiliana]